MAWKHTTLRRVIINFELTEQQKILKDVARKFAEKEMLPTLQYYETNRMINFDLIKKMGEMGFVGIHLPKEYSGTGLDLLSSVIVWEQLSWASWTQTLVSLGHGVLAGTILNLCANEEQKRKYLPPLCRGEEIIAVATVEPNAGSDARVIECKGELKDDYWVINGSKNFISAGNIADYIIVLVQTDKSLGPKGMALIIMDKDTPGFSAVRNDLIGDRAGDVANLFFTDCKVPKENLIGQIGRGLQNALKGIDTARLFLSAGALGMAQSCLDSSIKYAKERVQFGRPIGGFQLIQETIARIYAELSCVKWQVYYAAMLKDKGLPHGKELSAAKWLSTELAVKASAEAIRIHGAYGCSDEYPVARHYVDSILSNILGGTREMHKLTIGRELLGINAMY